MIGNPHRPVDADDSGAQAQGHTADPMLATPPTPEPQRHQHPEHPEHAAAPQPPRTGDVELDAAMSDLGRAQTGSFSERIESGERVHRLLQGRLGDLGRA